jgi:two-component system, cell cycle sensor histidine kinase and response regulator CckA
MSAVMQEAAGRNGVLPSFAPIPIQPRTEPIPITVLLVDDDDQVRAFCRGLLTENGFTVLEARNGLEALLTSIQHQGAIDLLVTDLEMPGMSGVELGWAFHEFRPGVSVLYISGSPREPAGDRLPADCPFLAKPFTPDALMEAVGAAQNTIRSFA